jgi:glycosyltransferase involved in cell wall biosynthesis
VPEIFIVIPAYNERVEVLSGVVRSLLAFPYKIIVVDDGSANSLADVFSDGRIIVLTHGVNLGQGAALQTGIEYAKKNGADVVVTFDADGQHDATDLDTLLNPVVNEKADIALGSRFLRKDQFIPFRKKIVLGVARWIHFLFTGILLTDAHNGLRAFGAAALEKISITENRMAHASEILFEIKKHKLKYVEVPVQIHYTDYSNKKGQSAWDSIKVLFDLVLHKLFK